MTVDISTIGIEFDTSGMLAGQRALNDTLQSANKTADAADKVGAAGSRNFKQFGDSAAAAERQTKLLAETTSTLNKVIGTATAALGGMEMIKQIDEYTKYTAQLKLATTSQNEFNNSLLDVRRIAKDAQADLAGTGVLYARIANGTRELGISQKKVADITETVNLALKVSGATSAEAASAMLQLSQSFASGTLRGEEFNAVNEAAPRLMKALADGIGVPVGALKNMASEGKITSEVMANVLPKSLESLREEAKSVQTIGGAFTVLKNNVLEFIGTQAEANGTVKIISGAIGVLADNLGLLTAAATGLGVAKATEVIASMGAAAVQSAASTMEYSAAQTAQRAASIAAAQGEAAAAAATTERLVATQAAIVLSRQEAIAQMSSANASIFAAEAQISASRSAGALSFALSSLAAGEVALTTATQARAAATAELAILGQQQVRVSAEIAAANAAQTASQVALTAATTSTGTASGLLARAVGALGGPIGAVATLLGVGVTAWLAWSSASSDSEKKATDSVAKSTQEIITDLDKQISKLKERNALASQLGAVAKQDTEAVKEMARLRAQMTDLEKGTGQYKDVQLDIRLELLQKVGAQYGTLYSKIQSVTEEQKKFDSTGKAATDLIEVRERLLGVNKQYLEDLKKYEAARKAGAIGEEEYIKEVSMLANETYNKSKAGKEAAKSTKEAGNEEERLAGLLLKTSGLTRDFTDDWNLLNSAYKSGGITLDMLIQAQARLLNQQPAIKKAHEEIEKAEKLRAAATADMTAEIEKWHIATNAAQDLLDEEYKLFGKTGEARKIASAQIKIEADLQSFLAEQKKKNHNLLPDEIALLILEANARSTNIKAIMGENQAYAGAAELHEQNKRFGLEYILDEKQRAKAALEIDSEVWLQRIALAGEGTDAQKKLQEVFDIWYRNQSLKPQLDENKKFWETFGTTAHDTFISVVNGSKDFATRLKDTLKNGFFEWLWQMTAKKWIVNIGTSGLAGIGGAPGVGSAVNDATGGSGAGGILGGIGSLAQMGSSLVNAFTGGLQVAYQNFAMGSTGAMLGLSNMGVGTGTMIGGLPGTGSMILPNVGQTLTPLGSLGSGIASAAPYIAAAALLYQGLQMGDKQMTGQTVTGSIGANTDLSRNVSWSQSGGFLRSDRSGTWSYNLSNSTAMADGKPYVDTASLGADKSLLSSLTQSYDVLKKASADYAKALGLNADDINKRTDSISFAVGKDAAETQANINKMFEEMGNKIASDLLTPYASLAKSGESASQTLTRLATDVTGVNDVLKVLGYQAYQLNESGVKGAEGLVTLYGGLQQMQSVTSAYYDRYYSDAEKAAIVTGNLTEQFKSVGYVLPESLAQLRKWIEAAKDLGTEAGDKTYVALMQLTGAFAGLQEIKKPADDKITQKSDIMLQIMEAQGLGQQALNLKRQTELMLMDEETRALNEKLDVALREKAVRELATRQAELQVQILELEGKTTEAAALKHKLEIAAMEEGLRPQAERIYQLQQENAALEVAKQHRLLEIELMRALGNEEGALAAERADSLVGLDEFSKGMKQQIWAANAAQEAINKAKASAEAEAQRVQQEQEKARQEYESALSKAQSTLSSAYQKRAGELQSLIDKMGAFGKAALDMRNSLIYGANSTLGTEAKYLRAKAGLGDLTARANAQDSSALPELQQFIELSRAYNASNGVFVEEFDTVQSILEKAGKTAMSQADVAKAQLSALNQSVSGLIDIKDATTDSAQAVVDAINALTQVTLGNVNAANAANAAKNGTISTKAAPTPDQLYGGLAGEGDNQQKRMLAIQEEATNTAKVRQYMAQMLQADLQLGERSALGNDYYTSLNNKYYTQAGFEAFARELGIFANPNLPTASQLPKFAGGGLFTNGIVSQPTTFSFGQMGEAGPEAIVPITQGPKGLGIRSYGGASKGNDKETIEVQKQQLQVAARNNELLAQQNEILTQLLDATLTGQDMNTEERRSLKQYLGKVVSQKAVANV